ncbi:MAG: T9SS type A sorting domain-containing protein, partial [Bacteroidales bacterium]|nr:T9SS type A sorting domain-containing protein [Bacteroidales bacterium]
GGSYGIYFEGNSGLEILNNTFSNQYYRAIYLSSCPAVKIKENTITSTSTIYSSYHGLSLVSCSGALEISANRILLPYGYYGLYMESCAASYSAFGLIANNFISMYGSASTTYGIYCNDVDYQKFYHNSVNIGRTGTGNSAMYVADSYNSSYLQLQNNIFYNSANGTAIRFVPTSALNTSDYNDFHTAGTYTAIWGSTNITSIYSWQSYTSMDANSLSVNPQFVSSTDLHTCSSGLNGSGYPLIEVNTDIDGQLRAVFTPDIGADEFNNQIDLALPADTFFCSSGILNAGMLGVNYVWSNGATSSQILVNQSDVYTVQVSNACGSVTDSVDVTILESLNINLGPDTLICGSGTVQLNAGIANATYHWSNGSVNQSIQTSNAGIYWVEVQSGNCTDTDTIQLSFGSTPISTFTAETTVCAGESSTVVFYGTATGTAQFNWNFDGGNAQPGTGMGPHYVNWANAGTYYLSLEITDNGCTSSTYQQTVHVLPIPASSFSLSSHQLCAGDTCAVQYSSSTNQTLLLDWTLPAGNTSPVNNDTAFNLVYLNPGMYVISLAAEENSCVSGSTQDTLWVSAVPTSDFNLSASGICAHDTIFVQYTGASSVSAIYNWEFPGAVVLNGSGAGPYQLKYNNPTQTIVSLIIQDGICTSYQATEFVQVYPIPSSDFTVSATQVCGQDTIVLQYIGNASSSAGYSWDFDSASVLSGSNNGPISLKWLTPGIYGLELVVEENGCIGSAYTNMIQVGMIPEANFVLTGNNLCAQDSLEVQFTGVSSPATDFFWNFGGGLIVTGSDAGPYILTYEDSATHALQLHLQDGFCFSDTSIQLLTVHPIPTSDFELNTSQICSNDTVLLTYNGSAGTGALYHWDWQDATLLAGVDAGPYEAQYSSGGTHTISLVVEENGCSSDSTVQTIQVVVSPTAQFSLTNPVCMYERALLEYQGNAGFTAMYHWELAGAMDTVFGQGPHEISWNTAGIKNVALWVEENNCPSIPYSVPEIVNPTPDTPLVSLTSNLFTSGSSINNQWIWNGEIIEGAESQLYMANQTGYYQVEVTNIYGCSSISSWVYFEFVSVDEEAFADEVKVYPNPASDKLWIDIPIEANEVQIKVFDMRGSKVELNVEQRATGFELDIHNLPGGMYYVQLSGEKGYGIFSFVKE